MTRRSLQVVSKYFSRHKKPALFGVGVVACISVLTGFALLHQNNPRPATVTAGTGVMTPVKSTRGHSDNPAVVSVSSDFPVSVPLPSGAITGTSTSPGHWSVGYTLPGDYATVMNELRRLYTAAGFNDLNASDKIPFGLDNTQYRIQLAGFSHDHSNASTDVTIVVTSK